MIASLFPGRRALLLVQNRTKSLCFVHLEMKSPLPEQVDFFVHMEPVHIYQLRDLQGPRSMFLFSCLIFSKYSLLTRLSMTIHNPGFILFINVQSNLCPPYLQPHLLTPRGKMSIEDPDWQAPKVKQVELKNPRLCSTCNTGLPSSTCLRQGPLLISRP
jgi:hypothetical protein